MIYVLALNIVSPPMLAQEMCVTWDSRQAGVVLILQEAHPFIFSPVASCFSHISSESVTKLCFKGPIDNKWPLVQVMAWHQRGDKPLSEPLLNQFTDAYMQH